MTDIFLKIDSGFYDVHAPLKPSKPALLDKKAGDMTAEEIASLPQVAQDWHDACVTYNRAVVKHAFNKGRLRDEFRKDALEHVGLKGHAREEDIFEFAWQERHASGLKDVVLFLDDLSFLFRD